ncbi:ABC transporter substrate-binding protein [Roseomonas elaeocarpi]|uniref:ABC transporter substrate-binding protein n=1 Tax=Roseomonas elaeocarpi TaxID=907779 RepID=A0ABV6JV65_9PROT
MFRRSLLRTTLLTGLVPLVPAAFSPARAQAAAKEELVVDLASDPATLDPHLQWNTDSYTVYRNIFDNLVTRDGTGKIVPQVASGWKYADDTTLVFDIRSDITFHDGTKLTPADVVFSILRIIDPALKSPQLSQYDQITGAEVTGASQVTVKTKTAYPALLAQLVKLSIVPEAVVKRVGNGDFNQNPVGSGPYKLKAWQRGVQTVLERNDTYWRGKPPFRTVTFRAVPDVPTRVADLRAGRADIVTGLTPDDAEALKSERAVQVLSAPTERVAYLSVNALAGPTKDVRVRQAIAMAIDRDTLIEALQQGYAKPVNEVLTPANFGYTDKVQPWPYDPAKARALLKEAGAEGATITFISSPSYDRRLNEAVQQMLGEVGLKVSIEMMDQPTFLRRRQGDPENAGALSQGRWSCACQDADGVIFPLFRSGSIWAKYGNPEFDREVDAARSTLDEAARKAHYERAFAILREDVPGIGLFQDVAIYGARREIKWQPTANEAFFVMDMQWQA